MGRRHLCHLYHCLVTVTAFCVCTTGGAWDTELSPRVWWRLVWIPDVVDSLQQAGWERPNANGEAGIASLSRRPNPMAAYQGKSLLFLTAAGVF